MRYTKLSCQSEDLHISIEIDGVTKMYVVDFIFECEEGFQEGTHFEAPECEIINKEFTINHACIFMAGEEHEEIDLERMSDQWRKQFFAAVENYAVNNLEE